MISWHMKTSGHDEYGGGFNTDSSGTDYTESEPFKVYMGDISSPTYQSNEIYAGFIRDHLNAPATLDDSYEGNILRLSGYEFIDGWYEILHVIPPNGCVLSKRPNKTPGVGGSNGSAVIGGSLRTLGAIGRAITTLTWNEDYKSKHHAVYVKGGNIHRTYLTGLPNNPDGAFYVGSDTSCSIIGYGQYKGDDEVAVIKAESRYGETYFIMSISDSCNIMNLYIDVLRVSYPIMGSANCFNCTVYNGNSGGFVRCNTISCRSQSINGYGYNDCVASNCECNSTSSNGFKNCIVHRCYCSSAPGSNSVISTHPYPQPILVGLSMYYGHSNPYISLKLDAPPAMLINSVIHSVADGQLISSDTFVNMKNFANNIPQHIFRSDMRILPESMITIDGFPFQIPPQHPSLLNNVPNAGALLHGAGIWCYGQEQHDENDIGATQTHVNLSPTSESRSRRQLGL